MTLAFMDIGFGEMIVVGFVALMLFGGRLPEVMRTLGGGYRKLRRGMDDLTRQTSQVFDVRSQQPPYQPTPPAAAPAALPVATPSIPDGAHVAGPSTIAAPTSDAGPVARSTPQSSDSDDPPPV